MKTTIVTTTIYVPQFLTAYSEDADFYGHTDVDFIVVGDLKSPVETGTFCETIPNCRYLDLNAQAKYMERFSLLAAHLPLNSAERRNIGILMAYENGANSVITLDDDNYAMGCDVVASHGIVGNTVKLPIFRSTTGWFNVCSFLKEQNNVEFYHRGYPSRQRWNDGFVVSQQEIRHVVVNAGFWLDNPDVDAITRLERELVVIGYKPDWKGTIALAPGTWSPFNCQNTALHRNVIPAYFLSPCIGRHADILASFVVNRLTEHFQDVISFGYPLARHTRTAHNLWKDLDAERNGILMADHFCEALRGIKLSAETYHEGFGEIIEGLKVWSQRSYLDADPIIHGMELWHEAFKSLGVK